MKTLLVIASVFLLVAGVSAQDDTIFVNIGELNGAADSVVVSQNTWIDVPVFFAGGAAEVNCTDVVYPLGINNCYFDSIDIDNCRWHYPFTYWDNRLFYNWNPDWQTDGEGHSWDSYTFLGMAHVEPPIGSPHLRIFPDDPPVHGLTFRIHSAEDAALTDTAMSDAIGPGYDPESGLAWFGYPDAGLDYEVCQSFARYLISANHPPDPFEVALPGGCSFEDFSVDFDIRDADGDQPEVTSNFGEVIFNSYTDDGEARIFHYTLNFVFGDLCGECINEEVIITAIDPNRPDVPVTASAGTLSFPGEITIKMEDYICVWPGIDEWMPVYIETCGDCFCLGGFVFTVEYDNAVLEVTDIAIGDALINGEYWNVQYDVDGPGTLRATFINDLNNLVPAEEICALDPDEPIFKIKFLLIPELEYPVNFSIPVCFMYDAEGEEHWDYNNVSDSSRFNVWLNDGCDLPDTSGYATYQLSMECGYLKILTGCDPHYSPGDINLNGYTFEIGDAVLLANHIVDSDNYPFSLMQMFNSDVNMDGLQATVADLVYMMGVIMRFNNPGGKVAPRDIITDVTITENDYGGADVIVNSDAAIGGALVTLNHTGVQLGAPVCDGMDIQYRDNGEVMTVLVYSLEAASLVPGANILFTVPVLSEGNISLGDVSVSDSRGALLDARIAPDSPIPDKFSLSQNFPNPFNAITSITYTLPESRFVELVIFDLLGREIEILVKENQGAGEYCISYNASGLASGVYYYHLRAGDFSESRKMILLK